MRIWVTELGDVEVNGETVTRPRGLPYSEDSPWISWPIFDNPDTPELENYVVAFAKASNEAPTWGRDFGDPLHPSFHTEALGSNATDTIEDWVGLERGELTGATRPEALRAILQDDGQLLGIRWRGVNPGPALRGSRPYEVSTRRIRKFRRGDDRVWFDDLTQAQRNFIRNLTDEQKDVLRALPIPDRAGYLQGLQ